MVSEPYDGLVVSFRLWGQGFCQFVWLVGGLEWVGGFMLSVKCTRLLYALYHIADKTSILACVTFTLSGGYEFT